MQEDNGTSSMEVDDMENTVDQIDDSPRTEITDNGVMKLGGNIDLDGFSEVDKAHMVVVKKIVGNYAKDMGEKSGNFERLVVCMDSQDGFKVHSELTAGGSKIEADGNNQNIFMALNASLKGIIDKQ